MPDEDEEEDGDLEVRAYVVTNGVKREVPVLCVGVWTGSTITAAFGDMEMSPPQAAAVLVLVRDAYLASLPPSQARRGGEILDETYLQIVESGEEAILPIALTGPLPEA